MTGQKWEPGDVALATIYGHKVRVVRGHKAWITTPAPKAEAFPVTYTAIYDNSGEVKEVHPLVVIDPEDREQVERLANALWNYDGNMLTDLCSATEHALREFANPTPRIEEPTGLGAVVEDENGKRYVLRGTWSSNGKWVHADEAGFLGWADINAVRVLSEGVPAEADR